MVTRTHYHVLNQKLVIRRRDSARHGDLAPHFAPLTYDSQTGRASSALVMVT